MKYELWDEGGLQETIIARTLESAARKARKYMEAGDYSEGETSGTFRLVDPGSGRTVYSGRFSFENPSSIRAQVRRLPSGQIQLKIPIGRSENPHGVIEQLKRVFGKRVKAVEMTGGKKRNPFQAGLNRAWYIKGRVSARKRNYSDMYGAWHDAKGKPKIPGKRVEAQESFFQGYMDVQDSKK